MSNSVHYHLSVADLHAHHFEIKIVIDAPKPDGQVLRCPRWIPGSYLIRDFAKHILRVTAEDTDGASVLIEKQAIDTWYVPTPPKTLVVKVLVYAWDFSVRGAHLDHFHGFYNPVVGCLEVDGKSENTCLLTVECPDSKPHWHCASGMTPLSCDDQGFGTYQLSDYHQLIDCPLEMGELTEHSFTAGNKLHRIVLTGVWEGSAERLNKDVQKICQYLQQWMPEPALDFEHYTFLCHLTDKSYGGLEHCSSTALMAPRKYMPSAMNAPVTEDYAVLLGLFSHEYFHNWFVKRIKPSQFTPYRYQDIALTKQLWVFEGFTSYYDDLCLVRSGVISHQQYLSALSKAITRYLTGPGHQVQTVTDSSFDAWIKFYQPNENTSNAVVSYYVKGALICLCLDAIIRESSQGEKSLDTVVFEIWKRYSTTGAPEKAIESLIATVGGDKAAAFLEKALYTTDDLPLAECLELLGVKLTLTDDQKKNKMGHCHGLRVDGKNRVTTVLSDSAAQKARLAPDDILVALNQVSFTKESLGRVTNGQAVGIHYFRDGVLRETTLVGQALEKTVAELSFVENASANFPWVESWLNS